MPYFTIPLLGIEVWWGDSNEISNIMYGRLLDFMPQDFKTQFPNIQSAIVGLNMWLSGVFEGGWRPPGGSFWADPPWLGRYFQDHPIVGKIDFDTGMNQIITVDNTNYLKLSSELQSRMSQVISEQIALRSLLAGLPPQIVNALLPILTGIQESLRTLWPSWLTSAFFKDLFTVSSWFIDLATGKAITDFYANHPELGER